jgi:hypothetical protein
MLVISACRFLKELTDLLFGKAGLFCGSLALAKNHESVPVLTSELNGNSWVFRRHFSLSSNSAQYSERSFFI